MHENSLEISLLFSSLIENVFTLIKNKPLFSNYLPYILRLYHNSPKNFLPDYQQIRLLILKDFLKTPNQMNIIPIEILFQRLIQQRISINKQTILYLLYLISPLRNKGLYSLELMNPGPQLIIPQKYNSLPQIKGILTDEIILTDLIFVLQGLDGNFLRYNRAHHFYELHSSNRSVVSFKTKSQETLTLKLTETGFLFRKLNQEILEISYSNSYKSHVKTYLIEFFSLEMKQFFTIVNSLESQIKNSNCFSLKSLYILLNQEHERLKWLNILWDSVIKSGFVGCQIINAVYQFYFTPEPNTKIFFINLMKHLIKPLINYVRFWMISGELNDENAEFFIENNQNFKTDNFWAEQFNLIDEKTPNFWSYETVEKIMICGKTVHFLKKFCRKYDWQPNLDEFSFENGGFRGFEIWIDKIYQETNNKAISVLFNDFHFVEELRLLKNYLLMCDGYFADLLLNDLKSELKKPCNQIYRHIMMGILEKTLKKTVQNPAVRKKLLERLNILYVKRSSIIDIGWDLFSLDLSFKDPISQIILEKDRNIYTKIFNFLVKIKRFQLEIQDLWKKTIVVTRLMKKKGFALEKSKEKETLKMLKQSEITRNLMGFFLNNFLEFLLIEGIESEWNSFENGELQACKSIDEIIKVHVNFLMKLEKKFMILQEHQHLLTTISQLFEHIKAFIIINQSILDEFQDFLMKIRNETLMKSLQNLIDDESELNLSGNQAGSDSNLSELEKKLKFPKSIPEIKREFERTLTDFLVLLEKHQFKTTLAFKLNYNEYLEIKRLNVLFDKKENFLNYEDLSSLLSPVKVKNKPTLEKRRSSPDLKKIFIRVFEDDDIKKINKDDEYIHVFNDDDI